MSWLVRACMLVRRRSSLCSFLRLLCRSRWRSRRVDFSLRRAAEALSSHLRALALSSEAPPEMTPDFWKSVPSRLTARCRCPFTDPNAICRASSIVSHTTALLHAYWIACRGSGGVE